MDVKTLAMEEDDVMKRRRHSLRAAQHHLRDRPITEAVNIHERLV
jgi:hypothetical protein